MSDRIPLLPADCLGFAGEDPLVLRWKARSPEPDFAAVFRQAADLVLEWILAARGGETGGWRTALAGPPADLYSGLPGVAIFAAAHAAATGRGQGAELAEEIAGGMLAGAAGMPFSGAGQGLGSVVYGLLKVGQILDRPALAERALDFGSAAAGAPSCSGGEFDVVGGRAGTILVLDRLIAEAETRRPAAAAALRRRLAEETFELLALSRAYPEGRAFSVGGEPPASGFAHGVAGAAAALARASRHLEIPDLGEILSEMLVFERSLYLPAAFNWLPSPAEKRVNPIGWCRGAPGVALARMILLSEGVGPTALIRQDLEQALRATLGLPAQPLDHLCCGNLSRAEIVLSAHEISGAAADLAAARWIGLHVLRAAKLRGSLTLGSENPDDPSFFQGSAGIGYSFLRLALPGYFPSILAFD